MNLAAPCGRCPGVFYVNHVTYPGIASEASISKQPLLEKYNGYEP